MLFRSHSEQDSGQVSLQDSHVGVTKSQLQRDEELGCVAVQQPGSIFRSSGALAFLGHRSSFENTSGTAGGHKRLVTTLWSDSLHGGEQQNGAQWAGFGPRLKRMRLHRHSRAVLQKKPHRKGLKKRKEPV